MKKESAKRSSLFLIELMIAILFFALASAVCIQVFAKSHVKSLETEELNMAVAKVESAAEIFLNAEIPEDMLVSVFPGGVMASDTFTEYYDQKFHSCAKSDASYSLAIGILSESAGQTARITFGSEDSKKEIYSLEVMKHIPNTLEVPSGQTP